MTLVLDDETVRSVFDWKDAVGALREAYSIDPDEARFPARRMARGDHGWLRTLSGVPAGEHLMGLKVIAASPANGRVSYLIPLFDQRTAALAALIDGHSITGFRTAATSALAADELAIEGPLQVAVIGSGFEARNHLRAVAAVRELAGVRVFSPRAESRQRFVDELADLGVVIEPAASAETAVREADLIICAARSRDETPTLLGTWLRPGMTVLSIGSTLPEQREVDPGVLARADLVVADMLDEVLEETGDLIVARAAGVDVTDRAVSLSALVRGEVPGRETADQILLYKSVGAAVQDLAVADLCARSAEAQGRGITFNLGLHPIEK
ncbi:ornithine cyclodeaminase family protein [Nocardioides sp. BP30]|uniref:ornithine cyclodeaminase family protein n=1 Tax=Nocardioides sp. BP30 TaxID=3036374 RepID=UPI002468B791|nr:ornithine cyclodeaminase family protein [Nocardioides sp. BP30]WGL52517.1 ornithine cyclodeaminase family protein [Nocardioides sp. BP30]